MILVGIAETKDEQDIIEPWVRHNMVLLDKLTIVDDSQDKTYAILQSLATEFQGRIGLERQVEFGDFQARRTTELFHKSREADFVFPLDADEFLGVTTRVELEQQLQKIPLGGVGNMPWCTFVVTPDTIEACAQDPPKGFQYRRYAELPLHWKVVVRMEGLDWASHWIGVGNHDCRSPKGTAPGVELSELPLLHFPLRNREQMVAKTILRWISASAANPTMRINGGAWHIRRNFDSLVTGQELDLCELSWMYAQDDKPGLVREDPKIDYKRVYSSGQSMNALALIAKTWENSLTK